MPKILTEYPRIFSALPASKFGQLNLFLNCCHLAGKRLALLIGVTVEHVNLIIEAAFGHFQGL